ncbi:hypothetical protein PUN28_013616 [Cardiocondyla obscurior]|uniref:Uncharacterized protein n=1 Tax=Cardiocondyla obscurior TaxID=286306 RepID=A0AAW2F7D6_9HYME
MPAISRERRRRCRGEKGRAEKSTGGRRPARSIFISRARHRTKSVAKKTLVGWPICPADLHSGSRDTLVRARARVCPRVCGRARASLCLFRILQYTTSLGAPYGISGFSRRRTRGKREPVGASTAKARAAIVVNFLLSSWRIREAAKRESSSLIGPSHCFSMVKAPSGLYER